MILSVYRITEFVSPDMDKLVEFAETNLNGFPLPLDPARADYLVRLREMLGLLLASPQWLYQ